MGIGLVGGGGAGGEKGRTKTWVLCVCVFVRALKYLEVRRRFAGGVRGVPSLSSTCMPLPGVSTTPYHPVNV